MKNASRHIPALVLLVLLLVDISVNIKATFYISFFFNL